VRERQMHCETCDGDMVFEGPPPEGDHEDCQELVCSGCGTAVVTAPLTIRVWLRPRGALVAPQQRRAA
jgi:hypothetical protein